jgi:hypothetical protein
VREAALLVGASGRLCDELGSSPIRDRYDEEYFARLRESLGEDAYAEAVLRGREMALEEATACALRATGNLG